MSLPYLLLHCEKWNGLHKQAKRTMLHAVRCQNPPPPRSPSGINEFRFPVMTCSGPWYVPCCDAKRACCGKLGGPAAPPALSSNAQIQKRQGKRPQKFSRWVLLSLSLPFRPYSTEPSTSRGGEGPSQKVSSGRARCLFFKVLPPPPLSWLPVRMAFHKFHLQCSKLCRLCPTKFDIPLFKYSHSCLRSWRILEQICLDCKSGCLATATFPLRGWRYHSKSRDGWRRRRRRLRWLRKMDSAIRNGHFSIVKHFHSFAWGGVQCCLVCCTATEGSRFRFVEALPSTLERNETSRIKRLERD